MNFISSLGMLLALAGLTWAICTVLDEILEELKKLNKTLKKVKK